MRSSAIDPLTAIPRTEPYPRRAAKGAHCGTAVSAERRSLFAGGVRVSPTHLPGACPPPEGAGGTHRITNPQQVEQ
jgi:hypothetical protein